MDDDLFAAIAAHDRARVTALLAAGADPNALGAEPARLRPIVAAIYELFDGGSLDVVEALIAHGADVNAWDGAHAMTPLLAAVSDAQPAAAKLLLAHGADPNVRSSEGDTPLRMCAETGDAETAALLVAAGVGASINAWGGIRGFTALGLAASRLDVAMISLLRSANADPEAGDEDDRPARDRMPARDEANAAAWDEARRLLG